MSSSRNKSNTTGLRILWIPGFKRHNRKGRYDCTNKKVSYSPKQKPNEAWSLGGSKAQKELLKSDFEPESGPSTSSLLPISCALGAETAAKMKSDELETKAAINEKTDNGNGHIAENSTKYVSDDVEHHQYHDEPNKHNGDEGDDLANHANTMPLRSKHRNHSNNQGDVNSIESITENNCSHSTQEFDSIDGSIYNIANGRKNMTEMHKKKHDHEENEICVKCLYYTCMCCECRIS